MAEMKTNHETSEKKNEVEFEKRVNPDGSYAEIITNYQNKRAEIREYDAEGNCLDSVYLLL